MKIRIWYKENNGEVIFVSIIDDYKNENLIECGSVIGRMLKTDTIIFELTKENIEKYMGCCNFVDLKSIEEERMNGVLE